MVRNCASNHRDGDVREVPSDLETAEAHKLITNLTSTNGIHDGLERGDAVETHQEENEAWDCRLQLGHDEIIE